MSYYYYSPPPPPPHCPPPTPPPPPPPHCPPPSSPPPPPPPPTPYIPGYNDPPPYTPRHNAPPPPPYTPDHNYTTVIAVCASLGGAFFIAFLLVGLVCLAKKRKKRVTVPPSVEEPTQQYGQQSGPSPPHY